MSEPPDAPPRHYVHASAVLIGESGVLIRGRSGSGKSSLALALNEAGARAGLFTRLIGDDRVGLRLRGEKALVSPHPRIEGLIERRGVGLESASFEACAVLRLVADLEPAEPPRLPPAETEKVEILGIALPRLHLPERQTALSVAKIMAFLQI